MKLAPALALVLLAACGDSTTNIYQAPATTGAGGATTSTTANGSGGEGGSTSSTTSTSSTGSTASSSSTGGGQGGAGGIVPPECVVAGDCPGVDNECRSRSCTAGVCGVAFVAAGTPLAVQVVGDCATATCDGAGEIASEYDAADLIDDGNDCTNDTCTPQGPSYAPKPMGDSCLSTCGCPPCGGDPLQNPDCVFGLCNAGACVGYIPVKCKLGNITYTGCDGFTHPYSIGFATGSCNGSSTASTGYCPPGAACSVEFSSGGVCL